MVLETASPKWDFDDATFERSAASFDNPIMSASLFTIIPGWLGLAQGERQYDDLERRLAAGPVITVPTITLEGDANRAPHPDSSTYAQKFSGKYAHQVVTGGVGHNLPQEAPQVFAGDHGTELTFDRNVRRSWPLLKRVSLV